VAVAEDRGRSPGRIGCPDVGDVAPEIPVPSTEVHFSLYERVDEGSVLLVFHPTDDTLVCTRRLCNDRDHLSMFGQYRVQIVGVNQDTLATHEAFAAKHELGLARVSDVERVASRMEASLCDRPLRARQGGRAAG
jgi:peroxiredoxin Q/BCP